MYNEHICFLQIPPEKFTTDYICEWLILLAIFSKAAIKKCINIVQSQYFMKYLEETCSSEENSEPASLLHWFPVACTY
jgi:hypothetical protein